MADRSRPGAVRGGGAAHNSETGGNAEEGRLCGGLLLLTMQAHSDFKGRAQTRRWRMYGKCGGQEEKAPSLKGARSVSRRTRLGNTPVLARVGTRGDSDCMEAVDSRRCSWTLPASLR